MKKILFTLLTILMVIVSCAKIDIVSDTQNSRNENVEIAFSTNVGHTPMTKAIIDSLVDFNNAEFGVYGYVRESTTNKYLINKGHYKVDDTIASATNGETYYWPKADNNNTYNVDFLAIYPYTATYSRTVDTVKVTLNAVKTYDISVKFNGGEYFFASTGNGKITVTKGTSSLTSPTKTYTVTTASKTITATLKDGSGKIIANKKVTATVNGKTYTATTNSKGVATFKLTLKSVKTFTVSLKFAGDSYYTTFTVSLKFAGDSYYTASSKSIKVKVTKTKTKLTVPKKTYKKAAKVKKLTATLKDQTGKVIKSKKVTVTVNGKKYTAKTNKKGVATVKVKLSRKKTYKVTVKFAGDKTYYAVKKTGKVVIK